MTDGISNCLVNTTCYWLESNQTTTVSPSLAPKSAVPCSTPYCISLFVATSIISIMGIMANGLIIVVIWNSKKLHKPTFTAIAALAVTDFSFLLFRLPRSVVLTYFKDGSRAQGIFKLICDGGGLAAGGASILHVMALSVLRYFILVHPLKSHTSITNLRIIYSSVVIWILAAANGAFYLYFVVINQKADPDVAANVNIAVMLYMSILPLVVIIVFHSLKAKTLRESFALCRKTTVKQMSRVITFVIVGYIVTTTPSSIVDVLILARMDTKATWMVVCRLVGRILLFLNFTINPFIYFVHSPQFRKSLRCGEDKRLRAGTCSQYENYRSNNSSVLSRSSDTVTMDISSVDTNGVNNTKL